MVSHSTSCWIIPLLIVWCIWAKESLWASFCTAGKVTQENKGQLLPSPGATGPSMSICHLRDPDTYGGAGLSLAAKGYRAEWACSEKDGLKVVLCWFPSSTELLKAQHQSHPCIQSPRLLPQHGWPWGKSIEASMWLLSQQWWPWSIAVNLSLTNNCSSYNVRLVFCRIVQIFLKVIKTIIILRKHITR